MAQDGTRKATVNAWQEESGGWLRAAVEHDKGYGRLSAGPHFAAGATRQARQRPCSGSRNDTAPRQPRRSRPHHEGDVRRRARAAGLDPPQQATEPPTQS